MSRMIPAELLRLRRTRAVWVACFFTVILVPLGTLFLNLISSATRIGGIDAADITIALVLGPGLVGPAMVGVTAGIADRSAGVFATLAATGRPRTSLFWARVPAVVAVVVPLALASWAVPCLLGAAIRSGGADPMTWSWAIDQLPAVLVTDLVIALSALGLGSAGLGGAPVIGGVLALTLGIVPIAGSLSTTPDWFLALLPPVSVTELVGGASLADKMGDALAVPTGLAVFGIAAWLGGAIAYGRHRTVHADA
ncbi:hypothetical protein [Patulibacter defluvii]|uniref:hypothetical protein n=1 Tax=Patulibacter defluvii TaxID=3095358 RepID=UPI002A7660AC|nr:hypothetical protein [Patulibacter sp. DM4]